ncbi:winged helix-turn-helix transcriptional regulator [Methanolobus psychrotolerans]|uniref:winged helix-turn-helix transcriptional regulator n=1 Tax=Methanolobus psychrotolerans TaxID=1874706 RepID=UPI0013EE2191|nr:winged helix-turn-helix transcriptional regulator [Methanolobus psychrotolerans]
MLVRRTITSIHTLTKAGILFLLFIFILYTPVVVATEYYVTPCQYDEPGVSVAGEHVQEIDVVEIPYWMFLLFLSVAQVSSIPEFLLLIKFVKFVPALGSIKRINKSNMMKNSCRENVFNTIKSMPGISFSEIEREIDINRGTLRYHINIMEKEKLIESHKTKGKVSFFRNDSTYSEREKTLISTFKNDINYKIISEISKCHSLNNNSLADKLGVTASTASWHVKNIKEFGIIEVNKEGKNNVYTINPEYHNIIEDASYKCEP